MVVRAATEADLQPIRTIAQGYGNLVRWPQRPDYIDHELATGRLAVCEAQGEVVGFGAVLPRGGVAYLADLFVRPDQLGRGIGRAILDQVFQHDAERATFASQDPRALPLYMRFGMLPLAPLLYLSASSQVVSQLQDAGGLLADSTPATIADLDRAASGRERVQDLEFLGTHARCLAAVDHEQVVGYGVVRLVEDADGSSRKAYVGPAAADTPEHFGPTVLALLRWAAERSSSVSVAVLGPHPVSGTLVGAGLRIVDMDTFMASRTGLVDVERYCPSAELG